MGYVRLNGSYNILKSINFQVAGIPSLCKEKNMNMKSMSYTGIVLWTVWELDVEDYEILSFITIRWAMIFKPINSNCFPPILLLQNPNTHRSVMLNLCPVIPNFQSFFLSFCNTHKMRELHSIQFTSGRVFIQGSKNTH